MKVNYSITDSVTPEEYMKLREAVGFKEYALWNATEQSRRALNPVDDSREAIDR